MTTRGLCVTIIAANKTSFLAIFMLFHVHICNFFENKPNTTQIIYNSSVQNGLVSFRAFLQQEWVHIWAMTLVIILAYFAVFLSIRTDNLVTLLYDFFV